MDITQEQHERAIGDAFISWYNDQNGCHFCYHGRGADPPDLIYRSGSAEMFLEITTAYYDSAHARMLWQNARGVTAAPDAWSGGAPDLGLMASINSTLEKKGAKTYPSGCVLVVAVYPDLTSADEFRDLLLEIRIPAQHSFPDVYVGGLFPVCSSGSPGGYSWWKLPSLARA